LATGGQPSYSTLANPYAIAVDANNNWYIADTANNRIRVVNTQSSAITVATVQIQPGDIQTVAGTGNAGYSGDNGAGLNATLNSPFGVAVDGSGNIYIADSNNGVVREVDGSTGIITTLSATKALTLPSALALDHNGNLFIADPPAEVVWELSGGAMKIVAGNGKAGFSGNGGPATQAELNHPFGVAVDGNDNLFIADTANNRVRCVIGTAGGCNNASDPVGTIIPYAYNGQTKFGGDGGSALKASRWLPKELALDQAGNLFIGGGNDAVVQRVDTSTGLIITVAGIDTETYFYGFFGDGYASTKAHVNDTGIAVDGNEILLIADTGNDRIRNVPLVPVDKLSAVALNFGNETVGQTTAPQIVTLQNSGLNDLSFTSIVAAGDFAQTNTCPAQPAVLAPTLSCQISITFTPTEKGVRHGTVTITDNGYQSPHVIKLVGVGD
jgi:sugar lactone lactonase YvrE